MHDPQNMMTTSQNQVHPATTQQTRGKNCTCRKNELCADCPDYKKATFLAKQQGTDPYASRYVKTVPDKPNNRQRASKSRVKELRNGVRLQLWHKLGRRPTNAEVDYVIKKKAEELGVK